MYKINRVALFSAIILFSFLLEENYLFGQVTDAQKRKIENAQPTKPIREPKMDRKLLVFSRTEGYRHDAIDFANIAFEMMGKKTGAFDIEFSEEMSVFLPENIIKFDAILLNNTTGLKFEEPALRKSLIDFVKSGKGLIGIHAATDNFYTWPEAAEMIGGQFDGHPWNGDGTWEVEITDPDNILNAGFTEKYFNLSDEIYRQKQLNLRENSRVLVSLNMRAKINLEADGVRFTDKDVPISWVRNFGEGRIFYCSFGHNPQIYWNKEILQHYLAGIQFALGDLPANTTPVPFNIEEILDFAQLDSLLNQIALLEYGDSLASQIFLREFVKITQTSSSASLRIEKRLIQFLKSDADLVGKEYICHLLRDYGTKNSVITLSKMLNDLSTAEMALIALEKIPDESVDKILREALQRASGKTKVAIINSIGERRDSESVPEFNKMIYSNDAAIATASIAALGEIASEPAIEALSTAHKNVSNRLQPEVYKAYLNCADNLILQNESEQANIIYIELFNTSENNAVRIVALKGLVLSGAPGANDLLIDVLKNDSAGMQAGVPLIVHDIPPGQDINSIVNAFPSLDAEDQVSLMNALNNRTDPHLLKIVTELVKSKDDNVRITALQTIGDIGDTSSVLFLAKIAAEENSDSSTARSSLYRLSSNSIDLHIVKLIPNQKSNTKLELIRSLPIRQPTDPESIIANALLVTAKDSIAIIRLESIKALETIAKEEKVPQLVDLLMQTSNKGERSALEKTIVAVSLKERMSNDDVSESTKIILSQLPIITDNETRNSLLFILGEIGDRSSLPVIKEALSDTSEVIRFTAICAIANWPTDEPAEELGKIIRRCSNKELRKLSLQGYVRMAGLSSNRTEAETTERFRKALDLSDNDADKKMVLSGLSKQKTFSAFKLAADQMSDQALYNEAKAAVVEISGAILMKYPVETKKVLTEINQTTKSKSILDQIESHLNEIEKYEDFITLWQYSGPYRDDDKDTFDLEFLPEKSIEKAGWKIMTEFSDKDKPWHVNLSTLIGGNFCVAYLLSYVWLEHAQNARIELGSNDGIKAWLNGKLIHSNNISRGVSPGDDIAEIKLKKGWNKVMLKIRQLGGSWGACARIRNRDGSKIENMIYQTEK